MVLGMTNLERLRVDSLLTVADLAEQAGVAPGTIRRIEAGKPATIKTLARLSTFFGVKASTLMLQAVPEPNHGTAA